MSAARPADSLEFKALTEIAIIAHLADNLFASVLSEGLTTAQFGVLNHLLRRGAPETISEIASALQVSQPTMSSTVKKLEKKGFTRRLSDSADGRAKRVHVTNMGARACEHSAANIAKLQTQFGEGFGKIDWETLWPQLTQIRAALENLPQSQE